MEVEYCRDVCVECHRVCTDTASYCLESGGELEQSSLVRMLLDCAQVCQTTADLLTRVADLQGVSCRVCAEVCARCAAMCKDSDDSRLQECMQICRACALACQDMLTAEAA